MKINIVLLFLSLNIVYGQDNYFDQYGRIHDKPVNNGVPSSNNGWFYSAIYKKLGGELQIDDTVGYYCAKNKKRHPLDIHKNIPISRDEILGLAYLGYLKKEDLNGWSFSPKPLVKFNLIKFVKESLNLIDSWIPFKLKHRNFFWKNNLNQIGHIAYSVPLQDRHFLLSLWGEYNIIYHAIHIIDSWIPKNNRSSRQIRFLKTGKDIESILNYYGKEHPSSKLSLLD